MQRSQRQSTLTFLGRNSPMSSPKSMNTSKQNLSTSALLGSPTHTSSWGNDRTTSTAAFSPTNRSSPVHRSRFLSSNNLLSGSPKHGMMGKGGGRGSTVSWKTNQGSVGGELKREDSNLKQRPRRMSKIAQQKAAQEEIFRQEKEEEVEAFGRSLITGGRREEEDDEAGRQNCLHCPRIPDIPEWAPLRFNQSTLDMAPIKKSDLQRRMNQARILVTVPTEAIGVKNQPRHIMVPPLSRRRSSQLSGYVFASDDHPGHRRSGESKSSSRKGNSLTLEASSSALSSQRSSFSASAEVNDRGPNSELAGDKKQRASTSIGFLPTIAQHHASTGEKKSLDLGMSSNKARTISNADGNNSQRRHTKFSIAGSDTAGSPFRQRRSTIAPKKKLKITPRTFETLATSALPASIEELLNCLAVILDSKERYDFNLKHPTKQLKTAKDIAAHRREVLAQFLKYAQRPQFTSAKLEDSFLQELYEGFNALTVGNEKLPLEVLRVHMVKTYNINTTLFGNKLKGTCTFPDLMERMFPKAEYNISVVYGVKLTERQQFLQSPEGIEFIQLVDKVFDQYYERVDPRTAVSCLPSVQQQKLSVGRSGGGALGAGFMASRKVSSEGTGSNSTQQCMYVQPPVWAARATSLTTNSAATPANTSAIATGIGGGRSTSVAEQSSSTPTSQQPTLFGTGASFTLPVINCDTTEEDMPTFTMGPPTKNQPHQQPPPSLEASMMAHRLSSTQASLQESGQYSEGHVQQQQQQQQQQPVVPTDIAEGGGAATTARGGVIGVGSNGIAGAGMGQQLQPSGRRDPAGAATLLDTPHIGIAAGNTGSTSSAVAPRASYTTTSSSQSSAYLDAVTFNSLRRMCPQWLFSNDEVESLLYKFDKDNDHVLGLHEFRELLLFAHFQTVMRNRKKE